MAAPFLDMLMPSEDEATMPVPQVGDQALLSLQPPPERPIDRLKPGSEQHQRVLDNLVKRLDYSERHMQAFYHRWAVNEQKAQAYIHLEDHEQMLKDMSDRGEAPQPTMIVVPFTWAAISTIVTFLVAVFLNRRPHFELGSNSAEGVTNTKHMETVLQYNCDHTRMVRRLYQKFMDICIYGLGAVSTKWCVKTAVRTVRIKHPGGQLESKKEQRKVYQGNEVANIDPYNFFPDPRVPMSEANRDAEFAFWRSSTSRLGLKKDEREYNYAWTDAIPKDRPKNEYANFSRRNVISKGNSQPALDDARYEGKFDDDFVQVDQGTCWIIPKDWGLSDSEDPELWIFSIGNKKQVFQAEPFDADHAQHPIAVSEPFGLGYGFGQPSPTDFVTPIQDLVSALVNTHLVNVRSVLNDCFVYDPSAIEAQDMKDMGPGRRYRLKPSAFGRDVRSIIQQIPVQDVTAQHMNDAQVFMNVGLMLLGLNQNMIGASTPSSRRSATESRITAEASASRLSLLSRLTSGQGVIDMVEQMILNIQQNIDAEFTLQVLGEKGMMESVIVQPENLVGDFYYPIHDGTLPMDKIGLLEVWKELIGVVIQDEQLRAEWDVSKMVEFAANLGGAQNVHMMRRQQPPQMQFGTEEALAQGAQSGNLVPAPPGLVNPLLVGLGNPGGV